MGVSITNFGRSGLHDWLIQRFTAVVLALYTVFVIGYLIGHPELSYPEWKQLFDNTAMKIFTLLALISTIAHAWIGMWTFSTDYLKKTAVRFTFQIVCFLAMFVYLVWGIELIWGL